MFNLSKFPSTRLRRMRQSSWVRDLVSESCLNITDLILPIFIRTFDFPAEISSLPEIQRYTLQELPYLIDTLNKTGIIAVALFPVTPKHLRTPCAKEALNPENLICQAIRLIKSINPELGIITDVALDPYTDHGHDGVVIDNQVDNDETIAILCKQALIQAQAGADAIAPSDMMDGRIGTIRAFLDSHGFKKTLLISYAVKYASAFYGPFRNALGVDRLQGLTDKKTYQINPSNANEALHEAALDIQEGADMLIIKPGLPYLDILHRVSTTFQIPTIAYQVSGEYASIMAASYNGWLNADQVFLESLLSFKRAGACGILTYCALKIAPYLQ